MSPMRHTLPFRGPKPPAISDRAALFLNGYRTASTPRSNSGVHSLRVESGFPR